MNEFAHLRDNWAQLDEIMDRCEFNDELRQAARQGVFDHFLQQIIRLIMDRCITFGIEINDDNFDQVYKLVCREILAFSNRPEYGAAANGSDSHAQNKAITLMTMKCAEVLFDRMPAAPRRKPRRRRPLTRPRLVAVEGRLIRLSPATPVSPSPAGAGTTAGA